MIHSEYVVSGIRGKVAPTDDKLRSLFQDAAGVRDVEILPSGKRALVFLSDGANVGDIRKIAKSNNLRFIERCVGRLAI